MVKCDVIPERMPTIEAYIYRHLFSSEVAIGKSYGEVELSVVPLLVISMMLRASLGLGLRIPAAPGPCSHHGPGPRSWT